MKQLAKQTKEKEKTKTQKEKKVISKEEKDYARELEQIKRVEARNIRENWFKLDNAALIYPAIGSAQWNSVFRMSVITRQPVDKDKLQQALDLTLLRYPFYNVSLREGMFWHYFQVLESKPLIEPEKDYPCRPFIFNERKQIFRVLYMDNKISFESFHSLADGGGAAHFFNTLLVCYFELCGADIKNYLNFNVRDLPDSEENEDAFKRFFDKTKSRPRKEKTAYAVKGNLEPIQVLKTITGLVSVTKLKEITKQYDATVNEFLTAIYFQALIAEKVRSNKQHNRPVKISVPVNMRKFYSTKTMRNFSQFINMEMPIEKENSDFTEILARVKEESKLFNKEYLQGSINANVKSERNFFVRIMPLCVKNFALKMVYNKVGERQFTSTLTNVGLIKLPDELNQYIEHYFMVLGATKLNRINLTVASYLDECAITFSSRLTENRIIKSFFNILSSFGLDINLFSNL